MTLLVFIVSTAVRMMVAGPSFIGSSERREELQAVKLRHVAGRWQVILLVFIVSKALLVAVPVGMVDAGLSFIGSSELVNFLPRLFQGLLLTSGAGGGVGGVCRWWWWWWW